MNAPDALDHVLKSLYEAMLDDAHWPATTALIDEACGIAGNGLGVGRGVDDAARVYFAGIYRRGERRQDLEREYFDNYYAHDERVPRITRAPEGQLIYLPDLYTDKELKTSPAYNEGARRAGTQNGLNVHFNGPHGLHIVWATADPVGAGGWQSAQLELIAHLLPHIRQFALVRHALAVAGALGTGLAALLDNNRIGVLYLDRRGGLVEVNARARRMLRRGDGLFEYGGTLRARRAADQERLEKLLGGALSGVGGETPVGGSITVERLSGPSRLGVHVCPVGEGEASFGLQVAALLLVVDPASHLRIDPLWVARTFSLTAAESRVTALLAEGRSVRDIAAATNYGEGYVRWLLKQVYRKQGVSGQVALVRLVLVMDAFSRR